MCILRKKAEIKHCGWADNALVSAYLMNEDSNAAIYLPDKKSKKYKKALVMASQELEEVSTIVSVPEEQDCDDFAAELFGKFAGLMWTDVHALNWFIDENEEFWFIEPQTRKISKQITLGAGKYIRFFIGR